jgi:hypothetical protein
VRLTGRVSSSYNSALSAADDCGRSAGALTWQLDWEGSKIEVHLVNSEYQCDICSGFLTLVLDRCQQLQRRAAAARFNVSRRQLEQLQCLASCCECKLYNKAYFPCQTLARYHIIGLLAEDRPLLQVRRPLRLSCMLCVEQWNQARVAVCCDGIDTDLYRSCPILSIPCVSSASCFNICVLAAVACASSSRLCSRAVAARRKWLRAMEVCL